MLFSSFSKIQDYLEEAYKDKFIGFVSTQTPLLSNLSILENISLIPAVHEGLSRKASMKKAYEALDALDLGNIASLRYDVCSTKEIFYTQLIRASMLQDAKIIIEQPFIFLAEEMNIDFILDALRRLKVSFNKVQIIDLTHQATYYKESQCLIEK